MFEVFGLVVQFLSPTHGISSRILEDSLDTATSPFDYKGVASQSGSPTEAPWHPSAGEPSQKYFAQLVHQSLDLLSQTESHKNYYKAAPFPKPRFHAGDFRQWDSRHEELQAKLLEVRSKHGVLEQKIDHLQHQIDHILQALQLLVQRQEVPMVSSPNLENTVNAPSPAESSMGVAEIRFTRPEDRAAAYEALKESGVVYDRLLYACARLETKGLSVLAERGIPFTPITYSDFFRQDEKGEEMRETHLQWQRHHYGYTKDWR